MNDMDPYLIFLIFVLDGIVMGIIGAVIGSAARGRSSAGFWWSFFLGPIGWIIVLLCADMRPKCPECRGIIETGARRCKNCGVVFISREIAIAHAPSPNIYQPMPKIHRQVPRVKATL